MRAPEGWVQLKPGQHDQGVTLLFSFKDLYLLGFLHNNIWYVFDDADLGGSGHLEAQNKQHWTTLGFGGGYNNSDSFTAVSLGLLGLYYTHDSLSHYLDRKTKDQRQEIENALFRVIVVISEARRFPAWLAHLQAGFAAYESFVVDTPSMVFSLVFKKWSAISKRVFVGPVNIVAGDGFATYAELILSVSVLLRTSV